MACVPESAIGVGTGVDSTSKRTNESFVDDLAGCSIAEALARPIIERVNDEGKLTIGYLREVSTLGEVAAQQPIGIFVDLALPGAVRVGEEHPRPGSPFDPLEGGELLAIIQSESVPEFRIPAFLRTPYLIFS